MQPLQAFGRLRKRVFGYRDLSFSTKLHVCDAIVIITLLYGSEARTCYAYHLSRKQN